jgi:hypothetical protein
LIKKQVKYTRENVYSQNGEDGIIRKSKNFDLFDVNTENEININTENEINMEITNLKKNIDVFSLINY